VNFAILRPEKYDFDMYKGNFVKKNGLYSPDFEKNNIKIASFLQQVQTSVGQFPSSWRDPG
jgi:hypothetical protein